MQLCVCTQHQSLTYSYMQDRILIEIEYFWCIELMGAFQVHLTVLVLL